ncbi:MurR/RpiR family transcriptional regulator [Tuberibacillus sp. Marseille-P3662]|uniref:MurR/RpiR family transcriptional regulator n=1 Tax=Tuberibacillus sp. Marseille-P3662 TaxID=1965358 RepID=UPI0020CAD5CB|nr:MurR/RpiR family transcriptional regulator [Tuberibacillus sp. Marseille-P3662]
MSNQNGSLLRLEAVVSQLYKKEKLVADYILANPDEVVHQSITELADNVGVAESTIFRLCKRIGFDGYQGFKIALARDVVNAVENIYQEIDEADASDVLMDKVFQGHIQGLQDTLQLYDATMLDQAIKVLAGATRIDFYGTGGSGMIAQDAAHKFIRTGLLCQAFNDGHQQVMNASLLDSTCVAFGISHSGSNKDVMQALSQAKAAGAYTIGLTQFAKSPMTELCDVALYTKSRETLYRSEALTSRLIQLAVMDVLYVGVGMSRKQQTLSGLEKIREAIALKRY